MLTNIAVIGSTAVYAVLRFIGVMTCVVLSIRTKVRRFADSTQLQNDSDVVTWHQQFSRLQASITFVSQRMLQKPLAVLMSMALLLAVGMFGYTFLRASYARQPVFYQLMIVTVLLSAFALALIFLSAQVRRAMHERLGYGYVGLTRGCDLCVRLPRCSQVSVDMGKALVRLQFQRLRTVGLFDRLQKQAGGSGKQSSLDGDRISQVLLTLMRDGCIDRKVRLHALSCLCRHAASRQPCLLPPVWSGQRDRRAPWARNSAISRSSARTVACCTR